MKQLRHFTMNGLLKKTHSNTIFLHYARALYRFTYNIHIENIVEFGGMQIQFRHRLQAQRKCNSIALTSTPSASTACITCRLDSSRFRDNFNMRNELQAHFLQLICMTIAKCTSIQYNSIVIFHSHGSGGWCIRCIRCIEFHCNPFYRKSMLPMLVPFNGISIRK